VEITSQTENKNLPVTATRNESTCIYTARRKAMTKFYSTGEVVRLLGVVQRYRIEYALSTGQIPEPNRVFGKRAFQWREVQALADHFGVELKEALKGPEMEKR
jgi:hypothetical protein